MIDHSEIPVYNYIYDDNNLTWGRYMQLVRCGLHEPLDKAMWYSSEFHLQKIIVKADLNVQVLFVRHHSIANTIQLG